MAELGTFTSGSVLTAAELNQFNNFTALYGSSTVTVSGAGTALEFTSAGQVVADVSNWHSTSTNPSRITVDKDGIYFISAACQYSYNSTAAKFYINIMRNGVVLFDMGTVDGYYPGRTISGVLSASAGDYFETGCYQDTGGNVGMHAGRNGFFVALLRTT